MSIAQYLGLCFVLIGSSLMTAAAAHYGVPIPSDGLVLFVPGVILAGVGIWCGLVDAVIREREQIQRKD
jgi:hypothetical protein